MQPISGCRQVRMGPKAYEGINPVYEQPPPIIRVQLTQYEGVVTPLRWLVPES